MNKRGGRDGDLGVEELNVGAWGNPTGALSNPGGGWRDPMVDPPPASPPIAPGPPTGPPRSPGDEWTTTIGPGGGGPPPGQRTTAWLRRHAKHLIAGVGAFALLVAVVAVATGSGGDPEAAPTTPPSTVPPSTTERRPVLTATPSTTEAPEPSSDGTGDAGPADDTDYRFVLAEVPDGFEVTGADQIDVVEDWMVVPDGPTLFAADGTTWQSGPWLTISGGDGQSGQYSMFPFTRPPMVYEVGDADARTGSSVDGIEVTTLRRGATTVEIAARGLDPLATAAVAQSLQLTDGATSIPDAAIPAGLRRRTDIDVTAWSWGWAPGTRASVSYGSIDQTAWMSFNVRSLDEEPDLLASAPYFLTDMRYLSVGGGAGVAGTYDSAGGDAIHYAVWRLADREYVANATGIELDELIGYAGQVLQPGNPQWRADLWDDAVDDSQDCCQQQPGEITRPVDVPIGSGADYEWLAQVAVQGGSVDWYLSTRGNGDGLGMQSPLGAPMLHVGSRYGWVGGPAEFPAAAVALVDRAMVGTVLRLTTTGAEPQTVEVVLQAVDDDLLAPYLVGAVVLPWIDGGFVAQLVAPDGQTIAVQTDADLP